MKTLKSLLLALALGATFVSNSFAADAAMDLDMGGKEAAAVVASKAPFYSVKAKRWYFNGRCVTASDAIETALTGYATADAMKSAIFTKDADGKMHFSGELVHGGGFVSKKVATKIATFIDAAFAAKNAANTVENLSDAATETEAGIATITAAVETATQAAAAAEEEAPDVVDGDNVGDVQAVESGIVDTLSAAVTVQAQRVFSSPAVKRVARWFGW